MNQIIIFLVNSPLNKSLFAVFPDFNVLVIGWGWCFHSETQFLLFRHFQLANAFLDRKSLMYLHA